MNTASSSMFPAPPKLPLDSLSFIPLGGCGEFGSNLHIIHYNDEYLLVDCGFGFADERFPGVDILLPSPSFLPNVKNKIKGLVLTHAHEDHIGAVGALWPQFNCPIYASPLTARMVSNKLREWGIEKRAALNVVPLEGRVQIGQFDVEFINASHSVPETSMLFIRTPVGNVLHTADWRLDETPVVGQATNLKRLAEVAEEGIDLLIGDSTNSIETGSLPSELAVRDSLADLMRDAPARVLVSCFSSHVGRMYNVAMAAKQAGRQVGLLGRSLWRFYEAAREVGYLHDIPPFLTPKELSGIPRRNLVIMATGSQGEQGAALDRVARRDHSDLELLNGDTVIFSSRNIPGNEKNILRIQGWLVQQGVTVITKDDALVHVSGHGTAADMTHLYELIKPKAVLPVHGDVLNQLTHAEVARQAGVPVVIVPQNGDIVVVDRQGGLGIEGHVETGSLAVDGDRIIPIADSKVFKQRQKISEAGHLVVTLIVDGDANLISDPVIAGQGVVGTPEENKWLQGELIKLSEKALQQLAKKSDFHQEIWQESLRVAIRHKLSEELGKKPVITVQLIKL